MLACLNSSTVVGVDAHEIIIELAVRNGLPKTVIVGLPDAAVKESAERVSAAVRNSGYNLPGGHLTVNLAPADLRKEGPAFDLPIAVGMIAIERQLPEEMFAGSVMAGELSLDGSLRRVRGALAMAIEARRRERKRLYIPHENAREAAVVEGIDVIAADSLRDVVEMITGERPVRPEVFDREAFFNNHRRYAVDFTDVKGQYQAKRALEVAASGGHNVLMVGSPGSGKSMLAKRLPTIMPGMSEEEAIEISKIYSIAGLLDPRKGFIATRPFRSPHHSISEAGLMGGSAVPRPGEVSLAHHGVLFLDELPEFRRSTLESLRQPLEDSVLTISRASGTMTFPARFMLVAAMNPCPCGYLGDARHACRCSQRQIDTYKQRISGPLMDRMDMQLTVPAVDYKELSGGNGGEASVSVRERVVRARAIQEERFRRLKLPGNTRTNAALPGNVLQKVCALDGGGRAAIEEAMCKMHCSARGHDRILKVARTLADLDGRETVLAEHIYEAIQYRGLDRGL